MTQGAVIWFTGHSKSGKTTLSKIVASELQKQGYRAVRLDSDTLPAAIIKPEAPRWEERQRLKNENLIFLSELLYQHGDIVLIASVGRFRQWREQLRAKIPRYAEIYLKCSLTERLQRDTAGKYETHKDYFHIYEEPERPDLVIETDRMAVQESAAAVVSLLRDKGLIGQSPEFRQ